MLPDAAIALIPAPVPEIASEIGKATAHDLLATMPEILRRSRLGTYMDDEQLAHETGLSKRQIKHLRDTRQLPFVKRGKRTIRYKTSDVFAFMEAGRIPARVPIPT